MFGRFGNFVYLCNRSGEYLLRQEDCSYVIPKAK